MSKTAPSRSWEWVNHVRDNCRMASSARHLLITIATYADASGHSHPSQRELSDATGYDERHIRRLLTALETEGWVVTSDGRGRGKRTDFTIVVEPVKADSQSRNSDEEKRTPEPAIEELKADAQSRLSDDKSGHLEQQKRTSGTLKADICASEYKEVEPAIEPAIEQSACASAAPKKPPRKKTPATPESEAAARIFDSILVDFKRKADKTLWGTARKNLTSLVETFGDEEVARVWAPANVRATIADHGKRYPFETFAGMFQQYLPATDLLTEFANRSVPADQPEETNAWATLPMPGATCKPSPASTPAMATP